MEEKLYSTKSTSLGMENVRKRARQLVDLKWTSVENKMPIFRKDDRQRYIILSQAGTEYNGIPYSSVYETNDYVGLNISIETFVSAVMNPNSVLYKENLISSCREAKAITTYGTVCSKFAQYSLAIDEPYATQYFFNADGVHLIAKAHEYTEKDIVPCDIILSKRHTALVTDVLKNEQGEIRKIEVSEQTINCTRRYAWPLPDFFEHFAQYDLYRYDKLDTVPYERSNFVNVFDEDYELDDRKYDILTRRGDKANYFQNSNNEVHLDILTDNWKTLTVLCNNVEVLKTSVLGIKYYKYIPKAAGNYEAYLTDNNGNKSRSTYFCMTDYSFSALSLEDGTVTVNYNSTTGKGVWAQLGDRGNNVFVKLSGSGNDNLTYKSSTITRKQIRLAFKNNYGLYVTDFIHF